MFQIDHLLIFICEQFFIFFHKNFAHNNIDPVVPFFERIESISNDCILLYSLESIGLLKGQVSWSCQLISQQVVVNLDLSVDLEVLLLSSVQESLLKFLHIDIFAFKHEGTINIESISV